VPEDLIANKKAALFTGCFANYYYPEVGKAMVEVLEHNGVKVIVPDQMCCGLPMIAKGNSRGAYRNILRNTAALHHAIANGYAILTTCSSCLLFIKRHYAQVGGRMAVEVADCTYHFSEYLLKLREKGHLDLAFRLMPQTVFYHTPCHLKAAEIGQPTLELLGLIPGLEMKHVSAECCGMGGADGYEKTNYRLATEIAGKLIDEINEYPSDRVVTDCGGCKQQIEAGCGLKAEHPVILVQEAYSA
jgi:glycerol-3-phosphate dehydrogenase subunit C